MSGNLTVLVVGCGNIAGIFDQGQLDGELPVTHAGAYTRDGRFKIVACVEPDEYRRTEYMTTWDVPVGMQSIREVLDSGHKFDVISICSPTACHEDDLEIAIRLRPRLIFCEKPVTNSLAKTERIVAECRMAGVLLAVNHTRAWDPDIHKLQADMHSGAWGELRSVVGIYNKGILNNGSHMLELLHRLIGPMEVVRVGTPIVDFLPTDPTIPAWLEGPRGLSVQLVCGNAGDFAIFELQLVFSHGVIVMEDGGMFWRERYVKNSARFKGYRVLGDTVRRVGEAPQAMLQAVDNIYRAMKHGDPLVSTGKSALAAQRICEIIKQATNL